MNVNGNAPHTIMNLYTSRKSHPDRLALVTDAPPVRPHDKDSVEISPGARQLADSAIVHHSAVYFGTAQIHDSLKQLLQDQPAQVSEAAYGIIQSNFITNETDTDKRAALVELGLAQAQFIADNYMDKDAAAQWMDTMRLIAAISNTGTVDPDTNVIRYDTPAQRPVGAPDDYVDLGEMMRRFEPDTMTQLQEAIATGGDWGSILDTFARRVAAREDWVTEYRQAAADQMKELQRSTGPGRFDRTSTGDLTSFVRDVQARMTGMEMDTGFLHSNLEAFMRTLQRQ
ncbi:hypothetical protein [Paenibacillus campinasensis]|nr:hypothetical protein [Paenibacillus campinasensis]